MRRLLNEVMVLAALKSSRECKKLVSDLIPVVPLP
jgi:hypothetical protein